MLISLVGSEKGGWGARNMKSTVAFGGYLFLLHNCHRTSGGIYARSPPPRPALLLHKPEHAYMPVQESMTKNEKLGSSQI